MKILMTSRQFYPCVGGAESYMLETARRLVKNGNQVDIVTLNRDLFTGRRLPKQNELEGIRIYRVSYLNLILKPVPLGGFILLNKLGRQADIIHCHDLRIFFETSIVLSKVYNKPLCLTSHGFIFHKNKNKQIKNLIFNIYLIPIIKRFVTMMHVVSKQDLDKIKKRIDALKIYHIPGGVDCDKFGRVLRSPESGRIIYFGRLDNHKGLELLFDLLPLLPELKKLDLVYGSYDKEYLRSLKKKARILKIEDKILWHGKLENDDLETLLKKAQFSVAPSSYEGFGITIIESMAAGVIPIANNIEPFKNLIDSGKNGFLVNYSSAETASKEIRRILNLGENTVRDIERICKSSAGEFDWKNRVFQIEEMYKAP